MQMRHAGLVFDLPDGWRDESALLFVGPSRAPQLPTTTPVQRPGEALAVRFRSHEGKSTEALLEEDLHAARAFDTAIDVVAVESFSCGLGAGKVQERALQLAGQPVLQLVACVVVGPVAVTATASYGASDKDARVRLLDVIRSLRATP